MHGWESNASATRGDLVEPKRRPRRGPYHWPDRLWLWLVGFLLACAIVPASMAMSARPENQNQADRANERREMVASQIRARDISDPVILAAMEAVPRHRFVPDDAVLQDGAYADTPLPIGHAQTISQPYIVAYMTEALQLPPDAKVLEVGTGSGYQAAVLAEIAREVYSIEIVPELAAASQEILGRLGYDNVQVRQGDGYRGWPEHAPFDGIIVTAAPDHVPPALIEQLAVGARLVIPVGEYTQAMTIVTKEADGSTVDVTLPVRFVPMTGEAQR